MSKNPVPTTAMGNVLARIRERLSGAVRLRLQRLQDDMRTISLGVRQLVQGTDAGGGLAHRVGQLINQVTGYETCERLRRGVQEADCDFQRLKDELHQARHTFAVAIQSRSQCQKDLNSLLQRKQSWSDEDLHRFTELYRKEMRLEQGEAEAKASHQQLETAVDRAHHRLMDTLRERYQEEQLWSDKIRRVSTYGTISLMALNVVLFLLIQLVLEPRKRQRLLDRFGDMLETRLGAINAQLEERRSKGQALPTSASALDRQQGTASPMMMEGKAAQTIILGAGLVLALTLGKWIVS